MELYWEILVILFIAIMSIFIVGEAIAIKKRTKYRRAEARLQEASRLFFDYLNALVLEAGCYGSAIELCKAERLWNSTKKPTEKISALDLIEGSAEIVLADAGHTVDAETHDEIISEYKAKKNYLIWAMNKYLRLFESDPEVNRRLEKFSKKDFKEIDKQKIELAVYYSRVIRGYPRPWETNG